MNLQIKRFDASTADFWPNLERLIAGVSTAQEDILMAVRRILIDVAQRGDQAVLEYTRRFDRREVALAADLEIPKARITAAVAGLPKENRQALEQAAQRLRTYAEKQRLESWSYRDEDGNRLGQIVTALDRVGVYVPGGKAAYPSSVLMNVIPAKVAGVPEIIMCTPAPDGQINDWVLAAAAIAGADRVFTVGGAQAVAAMAYGTHTLPRVDKIVGPGNAYVAAAKREVFGRVGIDMVAGPSEVVIVTDGSVDPEWLAMDLFSQAEHDEQAQSILICPDAGYLDRVAKVANRLLSEQPRAKIIQTSLNERGALIRVVSLAQAAEVVNFLAPEHLELAVAEPEALAAKIRHAGAIFLGAYTAEAMGDYCAGPNHVLPTARTARFSSPLGVYDFQKRTSLIQCSPQGSAKLARLAAVLARGEGLEAHARSAEYRLPTEASSVAT